jgi:ferric-dicitrate binding protein FerR (iron transport regulator)
MSLPGDAPKELDQLLMALVDGELSYVQQQHLAALLHADPDLQQKYRDYLVLDALLHWEQPEAAPAAPVRRRRRWWYALGGTAALAAGLLLAVVLWPRPHDKSGTANEADERMDNSVAMLLRAPGAQWGATTEMPTRVGSPLRRGWLHLDSGFAHIEFYSGATVILEGPADFKLISRSEAYCTRGRLRATVPAQAQGFAIKTPAVNLVDRGTEFGLAIGTGDPTEVHVFQGKVELHELAPAPDAPPPPALTTGQSVRLDGPDAAARPIPSDPARFVTARALAKRSTEESRLRHQSWLAASATLRQDPSLVAYYTFRHDADQPWDRTLADQAPGPAHDGAVVGCEWGTGRWPGKQGLEFRQVSDRVRVHIPGEFDSITLAAWVRVDGLPNTNNSLLLADGWGPGGVHWQIGEFGKLVLGVQGNTTGKGTGSDYHAYDVFTPERLGKWTHLAVVYDRAAGLVTHYVDGQPAPAQSITPKAPTALRILDATIGNWNLAALQDPCPVRYLSGCMDELMLFARPLSGLEIQRLYSEGRPPS